MEETRMMADGWTVDGRSEAHRASPASPQAYVAEEDGVTLTWWVERLDDVVLEISYEVANGSSETILLCTPLAELRGTEAVPDPRKIYRYVDPEGVLHLTKRVWPLPAEIDVYAPESQYLTAVEARGQFRERIVVGLPATISCPYEFARRPPKSARETLCDISTRVAFSIGYVSKLAIARESMIAECARDARSHSLLSVEHGVISPVQNLIDADTADLVIPVQDAR